MADQLLLLRHAVTEVTDGTLLLGQQDAHLGEEGQRQAEALADAVARREPDRLVASPLSRCTETARPVAEATGLEVETDPDLQEIDFGDWSGRSFDQIKKQAPDLVEELGEDPGSFTFPGGEKISSFWKRVAAAGDRLTNSSASRIAVLSHGGVSRSLICHLLRLHPEKYLLFNVGYASLSTMDVHEDGCVLSELNNTAHLERG